MFIAFALASNTTNAPFSNITQIEVFEKKKLTATLLGTFEVSPRGRISELSIHTTTILNVTKHPLPFTTKQITRLSHFQYILYLTQSSFLTNLYTHTINPLHSINSFSFYLPQTP